MQLVKSRLPVDAQGVIVYTARVNAVRGRARRRQSQNTRRDPIHLNQVIRLTSYRI